MKFEMVKQPTDRTCSHSVLAMIVGESVDYVVEWLRNDGALTAEDTIIFLAHHGVYLAFYLNAEEDYFELKKDSTIDLHFPLDERPALLTVMSERFEGKLHQVFWNGNKVMDPSPESEDLRDLDSYKVVEYWPLLWTDERRNGILS